MERLKFVPIESNLRNAACPLEIVFRRRNPNRTSWRSIGRWRARRRPRPRSVEGWLQRQGHDWQQRKSDTNEEVTLEFESRHLLADVAFAP